MSYHIYNFIKSFLNPDLKLTISEKRKLKKYRNILSLTAYHNFEKEPFVPEYIIQYINQIENKIDNVNDNSIQKLSWRRDIDIYIDKIDHILNL